MTQPWSRTLDRLVRDLAGDRVARQHAIAGRQRLDRHQPVGRVDRRAGHERVATHRRCLGAAAQDARRPRTDQVVADELPGDLTAEVPARARDWRLPCPHRHRYPVGKCRSTKSTGCAAGCYPVGKPARAMPRCHEAAVTHWVTRPGVIPATAWRRQTARGYQSATAWSPWRAWSAWRVWSAWRAWRARPCSPSPAPNPGTRRIPRSDRPTAILVCSTCDEAAPIAQQLNVPGDSVRC